MIKIIFLFFLIGNISACTHSLEQPLSKESMCDVIPASLENSRKIPYWFKFEDDINSALFIAAKHGQENENQATFNLIRSAFQKYSFRRVVVEGLKSEWGVSSVRYLDEIKSGRRSFGEPAFSATEATQRGIEFIGGEISDHELLVALKEKDFSQLDLAGFYLLRSWRAYGSTLAKAVTSSEFPISGQFKDEATFRDWFYSQTGSVIESEISPRWTRPFQGRADRLQRLTNEITRQRDRHLAKVISESLKTRGQVLVVYGAGHADPQKCFLAQHFKTRPVDGVSF